jgi:AcrR family transcriptional regulator
MGETKPRTRRRRQTQAERTAATCHKLLDAAERCLVERGYAGTSTPEVCRRARVSNGSLLHHYGTRHRLLAATLERLYERRRAEVLEAIDRAGRSRDRVRVLVERMWPVFASADFKVILELWLAAANDAALRRRVFPVMEAFDRNIRPMAARMFPAAARRPAALAAGVGLLFNFMQGMGLAQAAFGPDPGRARDDAAERELLIQLLGPVLGGE